ncbi:D-alanine--D-alanine ligase [Pontiella sulfatireligans]|uniref:D-alanine--D-alanine ligase n=1 Tax=Pontiella sulfatireligans TaxID=2750658 RepID=A0A6C2UT15_9BACT|nr:D-alanine--D-alanine ligase [Pontiella sulfatireligans]VGO23408.1 D-alanine--D-alanine ligase B [Pontiella sulfatireligans]
MGNRFSRVAVLIGGISSEREVSLRSGAAVVQGLRAGGYAVEEVDVASKALAIPAGVEAVFIALHGQFGEDGEIQQLLTDMQMPFTGSGAASSRVSFDKVLTRECLERCGVPVPKGELLEKASDRTIQIPLVVKPPREGSSVGCHLVFKESEWEAAFADAVRHSGAALVEEYIPGRELTVGVVDGQVLPVVEIKTASQWYDYEAKYVTGDTKYVVPAPLEPEAVAELQSIALKTFDCLGASDFGRVDFRLSPEGRPYVLELNAIPGFTATSLLPKAAQAAGIGFSELCCRIMELAHL